MIDAVRDGGADEPSAVLAEEVEEELEVGAGQEARAPRWRGGRPGANA